MTLVYAYQNRGITRNIVIKDAAGDAITPTENDAIRAVIGRDGETPKLTVASTAATANGSHFTKGSTNELRLDASDLNFEPGVYTLAIEMLVNLDASEWKMVERQVFVLEGVIA